MGLVWLQSPAIPGLRTPEGKDHWTRIQREVTSCIICSENWLWIAINLVLKITLILYFLLEPCYFITMNHEYLVSPREKVKPGTKYRKSRKWRRNWVTKTLHCVRFDDIFFSCWKLTQSHWMKTIQIWVLSVLSLEVHISLTQLKPRHCQFCSIHAL